MSGEIRRFKRYPAYKDSGVEWLGEIPDSWQVRRLKYLASVNAESLREDTDPEMEMVYVDIGGVNSLGKIVERENVVFAAAPSRARRLVRRGDVIVSTVRTYLRAIAPIKDVKPNLVVSTGFAVVTPKDGLLSGYAAYALRTPYFVERVVAESKGVSFPAILESEMATFEIVLPSEREQRAIAAFLDRETARIDAMVAKKERLIELLQEKRSALVTRAVTKGLNPNVPMKDSGVEWLGKIPAHWEVKRWRYCCDITEGQVPPDDIQYRDRIMIAPNHIESGTGRILFTETAEEQGAISGKYLVRSGNIVYSKIRPALNKACIAMGDWLCSADMYPISVRSGVVRVRYLLYFILSEPFVRLMVDQSMRVAMPKVNRETLADSPVVVPVPEEQEHIVTYLDARTRRLDALIARVADAIVRLNELRVALISAAVTGKIDVREEVA